MRVTIFLFIFRGPNVSVLHLRSTSEPWETSPTSAYPMTTGTSSRSYFINRSVGSNIPPLTKHQSLGSASQSYKWTNSPSFHSGGEDGFQVQQRSLDENKRAGYTSNMSTTSSLQSARRTNIKLSDYHCNSEPGKYPSEPQRPAYLSLQARDFERKTPSPLPAPDSPPSVTPIISPPPAFQDRNNKSLSKSRTFFGKTPFLPRSNAIEDSDASPPPSPPPLKWKSAVQSASQMRKTKTMTTSPATEKPPRTFNRIPQTKSLEDTTATRRTQFIQHYGGSSSSSSSSMGFRSLDSNFNRPGNIMPRLSENTDSSVDVYEDADEEDNNSSSLNISIISTLNTNMAQSEFNRPRDKDQIRTNLRTVRPPSSSSTSSNEFLSRSPPPPVQQQIRRSAPNRPYQTTKSQSQEDPSLQRVRRSRSLQLPEKKAPIYNRDTSIQTRISPQHPDSHRAVVKIGTGIERPKRYSIQPVKPQSAEGNALDVDMLREAEVVTGFLYGNRSRAAAQALLMHRYNNNNISKEEKAKEGNKPINNGLTVYYVGNSRKERQKLLVRGSTSPNLPTGKHTFEARTETKNPCKPDTCDFWPHCAHRDSLNREAQFVMLNRPISSVIDRKTQDQYKRRLAQEIERRKQQNGATKEIRERRLSPNKQTVKRDQSDGVSHEKKSSPVNPKSRTPTFTNVSGSSSGSDVWLTASDRKSNVKSSGASTPLEDGLSGAKDEKPREMILTRPGSAPSEERSADLLVSQQRSMSLPKSFLSASFQQG
ncbi:hypothetical protein NQ314_013600 [Rhamnusium bicolor]|uniref:Uncharacterized protein n=1 Tax=Rhamnusium bicolor TaxID=1586634 RepID=A0AAV8X578_9CUCU|nr:hypothetical protein NQ314_013600 [Rhamnusium bicolor]